MRFWWQTEDPLDRHLKAHDELLEASKRIAEEANAQKLELVAKANGALIPHIDELGGSRDAGKSGTKL